MNKYTCTLSVFLIFAFSVFAFSQIPTPTPVQTDDNEVVKISTNLIQLDATVTDKKGKVVTGLMADDFEVYENGVKQPITNFSFVELQPGNTPASNNTSAKTSDKNDKSVIPVPAVPNKLKREQVQRTIALVVDDLGLSFTSMTLTQMALKKFVDTEMQPNDLVGIFCTASGMGVVQQFTSDKRQLYAAIERVRWYPKERSSVAVFSSKSSEAQDTEQLTIGTLEALAYVIYGMRELPGRKTAVLLSNGFALDIKDEFGLDASGQILNKLRRLTDLANRSSVLINTIDSQGLSSGVSSGGQSLGEADSMLSYITGQIGASSSRNELQEGLRALSEQTGGRAFMNNNDVVGSIKNVLEDQKGYYLLAYQPDEAVFDPQKRKFNKIEIRLKRPNLNVRYRSGYFGITDEEAGLNPAESADGKLISALISPFATSDFDLKLNALFGNDTKQGSYIRSLVYVAGKDLKFTDEADGTKKLILNFNAFTFGFNGVPVDTVSKTYTLAAKPELYQQLINSGFVYQLTLPVKKPGAYQLRVAMRDEQGGKIGSANQFIEIPDLTKDRLTLSGIVLQGITPEQLNKIVNGQMVDRSKAADLDPQTDTALRRFQRNMILQFTYEIYNAQLNAAQKPQLQSQIRVFHAGKLLLDGKPAPLNTNGLTDIKRLKFNSAIPLQADMPPGDYILQIIVTDALANDKRQIATQWIDFEIIK